MYILNIPTKEEYPALLEIWEAAVRATHHFLSEEDIDFFRSIIIDQKIFDLVTLHCVRSDESLILGFIGIHNHKIEMLFIRPELIGKGIGKALMHHALDNLKANEVDVNEQNEYATDFYKKFGFKTISRSELDSTGKPYPILHMKLD